MERTIEQGKNYINELIEDNKVMLSLYPGIKEVIRKFDGKPLNKRIQTALQKEVSKDLIVGDQYNSYIIKLYCQSNIQDYLTFIHTSKESAYRDAIVSEDNKLKADVLIAQLELWEKQTTERIKILNEQKNNLEEYTEKYFKIKEDMKKFYEVVHREVRDTMDFTFDLYKGRNQ